MDVVVVVLSEVSRQSVRFTDEILEAFRERRPRLARCLGKHNLYLLPFGQLGICIVQHDYSVFDVARVGHGSLSTRQGRTTSAPPHFTGGPKAIP